MFLSTLLLMDQKTEGLEYCKEHRVAEDRGHGGSLRLSFTSHGWRLFVHAGSRGRGSVTRACQHSSPSVMVWCLRLRACHVHEDVPVLCQRPGLCHEIWKLGVRNKEGVTAHLGASSSLPGLKSESKGSTSAACGPPSSYRVFIETQLRKENNKATF